MKPTKPVFLKGRALRRARAQWHGKAPSRAAQLTDKLATVYERDAEHVREIEARERDNGGKKLFFLASKALRETVANRAATVAERTLAASNGHVPRTIARATDTAARDPSLLASLNRPHDCQKVIVKKRNRGKRIDVRATVTPQRVLPSVAMPRVETGNVNALRPQIMRTQRGTIGVRDVRRDA